MSKNTNKTAKKAIKAKVKIAKKAIKGKVKKGKKTSLYGW